MTQTTTSSPPQCKRCGACCKKGGPSLHADDKGLLIGRAIQYEHLITIRKGEIAFHPLEDEPAAIPQELVKLKGKGRRWECTFFSDADNSCSIYEQRPLECRLLQCWEPSAVESVAGQGTLTRFDLIPKDDPILDYILRHEQECPVPEERTLCLASSPRPEGREALEELTALIRRDLAIRHDAVHRFDIPLSLELFYFGRPIHTVLGGFGLSAADDGSIEARRT